MHVRNPKTIEIEGEIGGAALQGRFHSWHAGDNDRYDESIGIRSDSTIRSGDKEYVVNQSGDVRELRGLLSRRQRTDDFISGGEFVLQPQYDKLLGRQELPDGRTVYAIQVSPPDGQTETVYLDAGNFMIDRVSYDDVDGTNTEDYYEYGVFGGALVPKRQVDSNGDHKFDLVRTTTRILVDRPIDKAVFAPPQPTVVQTNGPVTVPLEESAGHYYVKVKIQGHEYTFLLDSGAQGIVLDSRVAASLLLPAEGQLEVAGAQRSGGLGMAPLDSVQIGSATLPVHVVSVLNLSGVVGPHEIDGVLGYPFFAAAEVKLDAGAQTMTFGPPGSLKPGGDPYPVDIDRELVEMEAKVNNVDGRFVVDTGNTGELLLFAPFMDAHPGLVQYGNDRHFASNYGVGGSVRAVSVRVDELDFAGFKFFNRFANIMLTSQGAFADRFDAGNIGMGTLKNLVVTFDLAHRRVYLERGPRFDDGRYRTPVERCC